MYDDTEARHGRVAARLRKFLAHPLARGLDLDSAEATSVHARLIREKTFLRRLYATITATSNRWSNEPPRADPSSR